MSEGQTRRSFLVELMNKAAGVWVLLLGGSALSTGCGEKDTPAPDAADGGPFLNDAAYGGPPSEDARAPMPDAAYGGPWGEDAGTEQDASDPHVDAAYGGPWGRDI